MVSKINLENSVKEVGPTGKVYYKYNANCSNCGKIQLVTKANWNRTKEKYVCKVCNEAIKEDKKSGTRLYQIYLLIRRRVCNTTNKRFGAEESTYKDVKLCDEWLNDFEKFKNWAHGNGYTDGLTIDRIDVYGDYEPENCRWVSQSVQCQNKKKLKLNTSGYTGVVYDKSRDKYIARLQHNNISWSKRFDTIEEAVFARNNKIKELGTAHPIQEIKEIND